MNPMPLWVDKIPQEILLNITQHLDVIDIKSLALTCRRFGFALGGACLVEADIRAGEYNSLFWACSFGHVALARACLQAGASPNVVFCHNPKSARRNSELIRLDRQTYTNPVFPTRFRHQEWLPEEDVPCSPLIMATKFNHIEIMKILLGLGDKLPSEATEIAKLAEQRLDVAPTPKDYGPPLSKWASKHSVAITHVRSLEAAELLIAAGELQGNTYINSFENMMYPPLELFLLRHTHYTPQKRSKQSQAKQKQSLGPRAIELCHVKYDELPKIVELFLNHGASSRRSDQAVSEKPGSPLMAAMLTKRLDIVDLMVRYGPLSTENVTGDLALALSFTLHEPCPPIWTEQSQVLKTNSSDDEFYNQVLCAFLDVGISPNATINGERRLLSFACANGWHRGVTTLLQRGADPSLATRFDIVPLVWSMHSSFDDMFCQLLESGTVDYCQPSLHLQGFTPLMFAAGDGVGVAKFERLLKAGAERNCSGQLSEFGLKFSILQCVLTGFPEPRCEGDRTVYEQYHLDAIKYGGTRSTRSESCDVSFEPPASRRSKFDLLVRSELNSSQFYTDNGRHVVNWVIDNLYGDDLIWALKLLIPHYKSTKRPDDKENPLATFFSPQRVAGYLRFGTLPRTHEIFKLMLEHNLDTMEDVDQERTLRHICELPSKMIDDPYDRVWRRVIEGCNVHLSFQRDFLKEINMDCEGKFEAKIWGLPRTKGFRTRNTGLPKNSLRLLDMRPYEIEYNRDRTATVVSMINLLLERGFNLKAPNPDGMTAYEHSILNETIEFIDTKWRDPELEQEIACRNSDPNFVKEETQLNKDDSLNRSIATMIQWGVY